MFKIGDMIIYGDNGVCKVMSIETPKISGIDSTRQYYTLLQIFDNTTIYVPVDTPIFMREVITKQEANELINQIIHIEPDEITNMDHKLLSEHYKSFMETHSCTDLIQLLKTIYTKNTSIRESKKRLSQTDRSYMKKAEHLLYGEFSIALDIPIEEVEKYIEGSIKKLEQV